MAYIGASPSNGVRRKHTYTATASQTTFSGAGAEGVSLNYRDSNYVDVYVNGVKLGDADYTATSGTSIVLGVGAAVNDIVEIMAYDVFSVADTVSKADGGQFDGNVTMAGTLGVTGVLTGTSLDISGDIDVDGTTNLDVVDIDSTLNVQGETTLQTHLNMGDNDIIKLGASADLQIYHDGSNSYIDDAGTGSLRIRGNDGVYIQKYTGEPMIYAVADGAVSLYYDNAAKLATTSTGIQVTGTALATTDTDTTNTGNVTLDFATYQNHVLTLTGNVTLDNPTTETVGQSGFIVFIQDGTGGRTVSLGTDYETAGGAGLTLSTAASTTDIVPYVVAASGRILLGTPQLAFS